MKHFRRILQVQADEQQPEGQIVEERAYQSEDNHKVADKFDLQPAG
jgi:hypothetical protein